MGTRLLTLGLHYDVPESVLTHAGMVGWVRYEGQGMGTCLLALGLHYDVPESVLTPAGMVGGVRDEGQGMGTRVLAQGLHYVVPESVLTPAGGGWRLERTHTGTFTPLPPRPLLLSTCCSCLGQVLLPSGVHVPHPGRLRPGAVVRYGVPQLFQLQRGLLRGR
jgi:hypothetical protein